MLSGVLPDASFVAIEAQAISYELLLDNLSSNGLGARFTALHGDLRSTTPPDGPFDLVTGTPPFMPLGSGTPPQDAQREAARFELRGGIEAYCEAAVRHLAPEGMVVIVMDAARPDRYERAIEDVGLCLRRKTAVVPRAERPPTYLIYEASRTPIPGMPMSDSLAVRDEMGAWTPDFIQVRQALDLPA